MKNKCKKLLKKCKKLFKKNKKINKNELTLDKKIIKNLKLNVKYYRKKYDKLLLSKKIKVKKMEQYTITLRALDYELGGYLRQEEEKIKNMSTNSKEDK